MSSRLAVEAAVVAARCINSTLRIQRINEHAVERARGTGAGGAILVTWHGRTFIPIQAFRDRGYWAMISTSRDGELMNELFKRFGFQTVRGSTSSKGAIRSALRMARELQNGGVLAHTPDGPRGPSHTVYPGAIFLAEHSQCPIVPIGCAAHYAVRLKTWDSYMVPVPFGRACMAFGEPMHVPQSLTDGEKDEFGQRLGHEISRLEELAEHQVRTKGVPVRASPGYP